MSTAIVAQLRRELDRREPHQAEFAVLERFRGRPGLFVDVGANLGQSVVSLRLYTQAMHVVCFEPLACLQPALAELQQLELIQHYVTVALGDGTARRLSLFVPWIEDVPLFTRASSHRSKFADPAYRQLLQRTAKRPEGRLRIERVEVPCARLDDFALAPTVLKVDVEGNELAVLRGATRTLHAHRPFLLVEPSRDRAALLELLRSFGYAGYRWSDGHLLPWDGGPADNVWFEPDARGGRPAADQDLKAHGLTGG